MQFSIVALSFAASLAAAANVQELISEMPQCAVPCLANAAKQIGCAADDNTCKCQKADELTGQAIVCVSSSCSTDELSKTTELSGEICLEVLKQAGGDAANSVVSEGAAKATSAISDALGTSPSATPTGAAAAAAETAEGAAVPRVGTGMGFLGAAAAAAVALVF